MDRAFGSNVSGAPPAVPGSPAIGYPRAGDPGTGTQATRPSSYWYHMVTEELRGLITAAGLTPDHTNLNQVTQAVVALITQATGNDYKASVRVATVGANINLAGGAPNTLDGVTLGANDRILVKDQTTGSQNGIYVVTTLGTGANGTWTRATDADGVGELTSGAIVAVEEGTTNADTQWMQTTDGTITIGTTALVFARKDSGLSTSNFTGSNQSKATSGYQKLPGGLIIQWGYVSSQTGQASVTWPIAFPNALFTAVSNVADSSGSLSNIMTKYVPAASGLTSGTFMLQQSISNATSSGGYSWIAIGW